MDKKPRHTHDCEKCIFLGRSDDSKEGAQIDVYWCVSPSMRSLDSVIGRFGSDGPDYFSSHPPEAMSDPSGYLDIAKRWYLFALAKATLLGIYKPTKKP